MLTDTSALGDLQGCIVQVVQSEGDEFVLRI